MNGAITYSCLTDLNVKIIVLFKNTRMVIKSFYFVDMATESCFFYLFVEPVVFKNIYFIHLEVKKIKKLK